MVILKHGISAPSACGLWEKESVHPYHAGLVEGINFDQTWHANRSLQPCPNPRKGQHKSRKHLFEAWQPGRLLEAQVLQEFEATYV